MSTLQTLDRGLNALSLVAQKPSGMTVAELAEELQVARAICYRLVETLEGHGLVARATNGRILLGAGVLALASLYHPSLIDRATPVLQELADHVTATAFLSIAEGDIAVAVLSLDPTSSSVLTVGYRVGSRHPLNLAAAGIAILSGRAPLKDDPPEVVKARSTGFCITHGQLQPGAVGVAAPLQARSGGPDASVGLVALEGFDAKSAGPLVVTAAREISGVT